MVFTFLSFFSAQWYFLQVKQCFCSNYKVVKPTDNISSVSFTILHFEQKHIVLLKLTNIWNGLCHYWSHKYLFYVIWCSFSVFHRILYLLQQNIIKNKGLFVRKSIDKEQDFIIFSYLSFLPQTFTIHRAEG